MKKFLLLIVTLILASVFCYSQNKQNKITFIVLTPGLDTASSVYIAGNDPQLGTWNPSEVKLNKINSSTWTKIFYFNSGSEIEFKFTKGTWNTEALTNAGTVPPNFKLNIKNDTTIYFTIKKWKDEISQSNQIQFNGKITGTVEYFHNLKGNGIKPRDIIVWLPPSYKTEKTKRYPVLYMHDGQNLFDPKTSAFGIDWQLDESADSLIKAGAIKEIIIVGIYNTSDRSIEYSDTKPGHEYMNFIIDSLKPFIDKNFRTLPDRKNTAAGGSSMGGLISMMMVWEHPEVFSQATCLSPAFQFADIDYVKKVEDYTGKKKQIKIYIDVGTIDLDARLKPGVDKMISVLESKGYMPGKDLDYYAAEGATHNEAAWAKRNWRYLEFMFGKHKKD